MDNLDSGRHSIITKRTSESGRILKFTLAVLLVAVLSAPVFSSSTASASSDSWDAMTGPCGDDAVWTLDADTHTFTVTGTGSVYADLPCNDTADSVKHVVIGDGIIEIEAYAFYYLNKLETVDLGNTVQIIGDHAFGPDFGSTVSELTIPESVVSIGDYAFDFEDVKVVRLPAGCDASNVAFAYQTAVIPAHEPMDYTVAAVIAAVIAAAGTVLCIVGSRRNRGEVQ